MSTNLTNGTSPATVAPPALWWNMSTSLSATESVEAIDLWVWHIFWFSIICLMLFTVADLYHGRNGSMK